MSDHRPTPLSASPRPRVPASCFITTAIDYTNGAPHIGHAYEKVLADVIARYQRLAGRDVFFLTGVDQHGQKVQQSAEKQGVAPQAFVDGLTAKFVALWDKLDVRYDQWAATTDPLHKHCVRAILQRLWDDLDPATGASKWIYKKTEGGWYSVRQEQFLTDKERGPDGEFGPEWGQVEFREEENFYFRLLEHKQWLLDLIEARSAAGKERRGDPETRRPGEGETRRRGEEDPAEIAPAIPSDPRVSASPRLLPAPRPLVIPDFRVAELRNAVEKLEGDLCISRPESRLKWGIPFPENFGAGFVTFVWFDALVNYISFAGYDVEKTGRGDAETRGRGEGNPPEIAPAILSDPRVSASPRLPFRSLWPALHVIGKDILIPAHGVYWPIMLKALGFADAEMPTLLVHGWWNISGAKMSKSLGNIVDPDALADKYGAEALRYYLMSDITTGSDADFSEERLVIRYNTDLANNLGNLLNRTLNMAAKYREGVLRKPIQCVTLSGNNEEYCGYFDGFSVAEDGSGLSATDDVLCAYRFGGYQVQSALEETLGLATRANQFIETEAPWKLAKQEKAGDQESGERLDSVLYTLAEALRSIAILLSPVLPKAAAGIFAQLNWDGPMTLAEAVWGQLPDGHQLGQPVPLFPRIEIPKA